MLIETTFATCVVIGVPIIQDVEIAIGGCRASGRAPIQMTNTSNLESILLLC